MAAALSELEDMQLTESPIDERRRKGMNCGHNRPCEGPGQQNQLPVAVLYRYG